jgi:uncharacterized protein
MLTGCELLTKARPLRHARWVSDKTPTVSQSLGKKAKTVYFEWDEMKRAANLAKHGLDFADAWQVFESLINYTYASDRNGERRQVTVGYVQGNIPVAVIWIWRDDRQRIISMRKARYEERQKLGVLFQN